MPVNTRHPEYVLASPRWQRCRDVYGGSDVVKARRTEYLPPLEGQKESDAAYLAYLARALFFPAMERTIGGLVGTALRKPPVILAPDSVAQFLDDLTLVRDTFQAILIRVMQETLLLGRYGVLVDWSEKLARPYWTLYAAEQVINWQQRRLATTGEFLLTHLVLEERIPKDGRDSFSHEFAQQFREFELVEGVGVVVRLWQQAPSPSQDLVIVEELVPKRKGAPLQAIPFVFFGPRSSVAEVTKPPLLDLADLSLSHYRSAADLEHGRHFTALPTPWITGWAGDAAGNALSIGSGTAWVIPQEQAKVGMLEFTGQGLKALETALESKERMMAVVGARLLEQQPRQAETAEAVRLRQAGEQSVLATIVGSVSASLTMALQWTAWWTGLEVLGDKSVECQLSRDFVEAKLNAQEVTALVGLWQASAISYETLYWNLQQGEWARPGVTWEEEKDEIDEEDALEDANAEPLEPVPPQPGERDAAMMPDELEESPDGENAIDDSEV